MARIFLAAGAFVLIGTAMFHMTGLGEAATWLEGTRGRIVSLLWAVAALNWVIVASIWGFAATRPSPLLRWPVWISALIPGLVGAILLAAVDRAHPGGYLLILSAMLAVAGGWRLR